MKKKTLTIQIEQLLDSLDSQEQVAGATHMIEFNGRVAGYQ